MGGCPAKSEYGAVGYQKNSYRFQRNTLVRNPFSSRKRVSGELKGEDTCDMRTNGKRCYRKNSTKSLTVLPLHIGGGAMEEHGLQNALGTDCYRRLSKKRKDT